jgi:serine/threonine protein kinase
MSESIVIVVEARDGSSRKLSFDGYARISLGRARDNDVVLADRQVMPRHATLLVRDGGVYVCDVADAGTWLDGRPVRGEEPLLPGERLYLGRTAVRLQVGDADSTRPRAMAQPPAGDEPTLFGRYDVLELLGRGGMAEVWLAEDTSNHRLVALKRILPALLDDSAMRQMFDDEARLTALFDHPGLCQVYEQGSVEGEPYIAMELIDGCDLRRLDEVLRSAPLPLLISLLCELCLPLDYAHRFAADGEASVASPLGSESPLGVVHRNVVPANVMVDRHGAVRLLDFGIARWRQRETLTEQGVLKGVLAYLAPEMLRGEEIDHRADLFAVGVLLYELLTGAGPFTRDSAFATLDALRTGDFPSLRDLDPSLPVELEQVADRLLTADPADRFASAALLREALHEAVPESRLVLPADRAQLLDQIATVEREASEDDEADTGALDIGFDLEGGVGELD